MADDALKKIHSQPLWTCKLLTCSVQSVVPSKNPDTPQLKYVERINYISFVKLNVKCGEEWFINASLLSHR